MTSAVDSTTLICLFHHYEQAKAAFEDLVRKGVPADTISVIVGDQSRNSGISGLAELNVPDRDLRHLEKSLQDGGTIVAVVAPAQYTTVVENVFGHNKAEKIDEAVVRPTLPVADSTALAGSVIPIVEEEMQVTKRTVDQGGVRVYSRVIEMPAEASVNLREEHVVVGRRSVDRPATAAEIKLQGTQTIELTETAEEAVLSKNVRVVEEVIVGKEATERVEHIHDTVRKTEVDVQQLTPESPQASLKLNPLANANLNGDPS